MDRNTQNIKITDTKGDNKMRKISFDEYTDVLHRYPIEVEITNEDLTLLENGTLELADIVSKYSVEYGEFELIEGSEQFDSYDNLEIEDEEIA